MDMLELFHIFKVAIEDEKRAQRTYEEGMKLTEDRPDLQKIFFELLKEEQKHEKILNELYQKHKEEIETRLKSS
jgi:rubrerythrin